MWQTLKRFWKQTAAHTSARARSTRRCRPALETLERRLVPALIRDTSLWDIQGEFETLQPATTTNYSQLAQQFSRHTGPTTLYVNFDGWVAQGVSSFLGVTNRTQDIEEILYRTAETFSPFDVQVRRITGDGARGQGNGDSTIFIGDNIVNGADVNNKVGAFTPFDQSDHPGDRLGYDHRPNSNPIDWAFADPIFANPMGTILTLNNMWITQSIAHEAGHTFGLAHVLSDPTADVMSYDAPNAFFADATFSITSSNGTGTSALVVPKWGNPPTAMRTQNSYTFLTAVLGAAPTDDFASVAHPASVQYQIGTMRGVAVGSDILGAIERAGDYDVFQFTPAVTQNLMVNAQRIAGASVDPVLMIFQGNNRVGFNDNRTTSDFSSRVTMSFTANTTYHVVVGASGGGSSGGYRFWLNLPTAANPDTRGARIVSASPQYDADMVLKRFVVTFNKDIDPSTFTSADIRLVDSTGAAYTNFTLVEVPGSYHRKWEIRLGGLPANDYTLQIGPAIRDFAGNLMNQDGDAINGESTDFYRKLFSIDLPEKDLSATKPAGSQY